MKERKINETFPHYKLGTLRVVEEKGNNTCEGCVFDTRERCLNEIEKHITGKCAAEERSDGKGVIFVKVKTGGQ